MQKDFSEYIFKINDLYIMSRHKYLQQTKTAYKTKSIENNHHKLGDTHIKEHLLKKKTYGVFSWKDTSKFICFDVDCMGDFERSRIMAFNLIELLMDDYNIHSKYIHLSLSGSKGYHIEIFFDNAIELSVMKVIYEDVISRLNCPREDIELRPDPKMGVKIPLGKNLHSNKMCWFCDALTFEPIQHVEYILSIEKISTEVFLSLMEDALDMTFVDGAFSLDEESAEKFDEISRETKILTKSSLEREKEIIELLNLGRLKYPRTRHNATLNIAMLLIGNYGWEFEETVSAILNIMTNTPRNFFDKNSTWEFIVTETNRLVNIVMNNRYTLTSESKCIKITRSEVLEILKLNKKHLRKLMFSLLIHSKRYSTFDQTFWMTYKQMADMGNAKNRAELLSYIIELETTGNVKIISRNQYDPVLSEEYGHHMSKPNVYKITMNTEDSPYVEIYPNQDLTLSDVATQLLTRDEIKLLVSKDDYYSNYKRYYNKFSKFMKNKRTS